MVVGDLLRCPPPTHTADAASHFPPHLLAAATAATAHLRNSSSMAVSSSMGRSGLRSRLNISSIMSKSVV